MHLSIKNFKYLAISEGISFIILILVTMPLKYFGDMPTPNMIVGMVHGALFMMYVIGVFMIRERVMWNTKELMIALVASIVPFGTFYVERNMLSESDDIKDLE